MIKNRQIEILLYLLNVKKTTHDELATRFEMSIKTIQRDIDKLSMMGIPVSCKQGNQGGVFIEENYKLSRSFFTDEDLHNLTFALTVFDSISTKKHKESILMKLALIAPELVNLFDRNAHEYFVVDMLDEKVDMTAAIYEKINHCLDEEFYLNITIKKKRKLVAPISYVLKTDGLYLYAFAKDYVLLKISTIDSSTITDIEFERNFISYTDYKNLSSK